MMPTVFLSRFTHQSGIHYRISAPDDAKGSPHSSMSGTLDNVVRASVRGSLGDAADRLLSRDPKEARLALDPLAQLSSEDMLVGTVSRNRFRNAIFKAARDAYIDMRDDMASKLKKAIFELEPKYYTA